MRVGIAGWLTLASGHQRVSTTYVRSIPNKKPDEETGT
jgi:hypothetical protein